MTPADALEAATDYVMLEVDEVKPLLQDLVDGGRGLNLHQEAAEEMIEYIDEQLEPA